MSCTVFTKIKYGLGFGLGTGIGFGTGTSLINHIEKITRGIYDSYSETPPSPPSSSPSSSHSILQRRNAYKADRME